MIGEHVIISHMIVVSQLLTVSDGAWLHPDKSALFSTLFNKPELVNPIPRCHLEETEIETDWTVFSPGEPAPSEAPPAYGDMSLKRPKRCKCILIAIHLYITLTSGSTDKLSLGSISKTPAPQPGIADQKRDYTNSDVEPALPPIIPSR